ncbi:DUF4450 domain-containing protein [Pedobacter sp. P351]|uniref:DUF4450 domain-containing protein n=1 Tax=Pedobacter superstes TaxID=3133441 RepID=UPI0030A32706
MSFYKVLFFSSLLLISQAAFSQSPKSTEVLWHGKERSIHYRPEGNDFVRVNGTKRFNRALYGTNTGFRVETGDLPEFALYLPGMGGNLKFGIISGNTSKWIIDASQIESRYRPGSMLYKIKDPLLGSGTLNLFVLAQADAEGLIVKAEFAGTPKGTELFWTFGGATGKKFSRDGDIGADPESSFYLKPEYCRDNAFKLGKNNFVLNFGSGRVLTEEERYEIQHVADNTKEKGIVENQKQLSGLFPLGSALHIADAGKQESPLALADSKGNAQPVLAGRIKASAAKSLYFLIQGPKETPTLSYSLLPGIFGKAEAARAKLADRIKVKTPDPYINTLGGALGTAADAIWEDPTFLHGAVAWRMRLNAWRGASTADPLGWHDRAKIHLSSYENSQVLSPESGPITPDTALNFARQAEKMGTAVFSSGYISRNPNNNKVAHHYDMNLVFFDQMLSHFNWNGDLTFAKEMWPAIKRHLAWEKRNFDMDGDGLYDAYCAIWASDALQYSGGGVTHSSSYNYRANKLAAKLAKLLGDNPAPYQQEADKILKAINANLWLPQKGWYAEYKDLLGLKLVHPYAGIWSIYHALDSEVPDPFQAYQALRYVDTEIPHIPIKANGLPDKNYYTISTTNWQPYTWSLNNVALAEVLHTALAYWQAGRSEEAFKLWESMMVESMYLSSSPGGFEQLSFYDAIRGELYRDFADPIGMASRSLVEGLFGVLPDALNDTLTIKPGLPAEWNYASLIIPDIAFDFKRTGNTDKYSISPDFPKFMNLRLVLKARAEKLKSVSVNGKKVSWKILEAAVNNPTVEIMAGKAAKYDIELEWAGNALIKPEDQSFASNTPVTLNFGSARALQVFDPQNVLDAEVISNSAIAGTVKSEPGNKTVFAKLQQGDFTWWAPVNIEVAEPVQIITKKEQTGSEVVLSLKNKGAALKGKLMVNKGKNSFAKDLNLTANSSADIKIPASALASGTNLVRFEFAGQHFVEEKIINWTVKPDASSKWQKVDLSSSYNDMVTNIYKNKYLSPRPTSPTLQLPLQGIGNWCYPLTTANIDDSGLRKAAGSKNEFTIPNGVAFLTPSSNNQKNIVFTSQWDNYPDSVRIPLTGKASHAYLLMAGSTNAMQSRLDNGEVLINYTDGTSERLALRNPETWWPIEQDYYTDDYAFNIAYPRPYRVNLKTAEVSRNFKNFYTIKGFSNYGIDGGAATVLDLPLNPDKELKELKLKTLANDVVIGLMSLTLQR